MPACEGFCPKCYANARKRSNYAGHHGYRAVRPNYEEEKMKKLTRPTKSAPVKSSLPTFAKGVFATQYPTLAAYMAQDQWEDKTPRLTTTLLFFVDDGTLKVCVNDREGSRHAFLSGATVDELLSELEEGLAAETVEWRAKKRS